MIRPTTLIAMLLFLIASAGTPPAHADGEKIVRSVAMSGRGEVRAVPNLASVTLGVMSNGKTARQALDANSKSMNELFAVLEKAGIERKDIATSNFNVGPRYDYGQGGNQPPKLVGYDVNNMVTVVVRNIEAIGEIIDGAVEAGSNQIHGISFTVSDPEALLDEARKAAVADARRKADIFAAAGGFTLGHIISLNDANAYQVPLPAAAKTMAADQAGAPPIAQGEQTLAIDVNVIWEIR